MIKFFLYGIIRLSHRALEDYMKDNVQYVITNSSWDDNFDQVRLSLFKCDVIKQNQSQLRNIDFKIQLNRAENVFCFLLF